MKKNMGPTKDKKPNFIRQTAQEFKDYIEDFEFDEDEGLTHPSTWDTSEKMAICGLSSFIVLLPIFLILV